MVFYSLKASKRPTKGRNSSRPGVQFPPEAFWFSKLFILRQAVTAIGVSKGCPKESKRGGV